jgi:hypothetical protein
METINTKELKDESIYPDETVLKNNTWRIIQCLSKTSATV